MIQRIQGTPLVNLLYYGFHLLGFIFVFLFNAWYGKKREIPVGKSTVTTLLVYGVAYIWIYVLFWIESGFQNFGGNNIVRGFIYIPLIAYPVARLLHIRWAAMCDFLAPCVCLTHGISHIGCIFVGCCAGYPADWGLYTPQYRGTAVPVQLFEAATALVIFALLVWLSRRRDYRTDGKSFPLMLMLFGSTRFLWEFARNNEKLWLGCSSLAFHALFMCVVGLEVWLALRKKEQKAARRAAIHHKRRTAK